MKAKRQSRPTKYVINERTHDVTDKWACEKKENGNGRKYSTSVYQRLQNRKASSDLNKKPQKLLNHKKINKGK